MRPTLARVGRLVFALASLLTACAQSDSAVTRVKFCVVTDEVQPDGKVSISCNVPTTKLAIPSKLISSMDTSKPYVTSVILNMQMTKTHILDWSKIDEKEEKLTSDMFTLYATWFEGRRNQYLDGFDAKSVKNNQYIELPSSQFKKFRQFDLPQCAEQTFEQPSVDTRPNLCNSKWQIFIPKERDDVFFTCWRPIRSELGHAIDRMCTSDAEIFPNLIVHYWLKRSALESGDWVEIDQRLRVFFQAMLVKE